MTSGIVYFIACKDPEYRIKNPHMKIGWTTDLEGRLRGIQTGSPVELDVMGYIKSDDPVKLEKYFHSIFKKDKRHGEWFDVTDAMLTRINCYHVCENRLKEFFLPPSKPESKEVSALKVEIERLKLIIAEKDKIIKNYNVVEPSEEERHHAGTTKHEWKKFARKCVRG